MASGMEGRRSAAVAAGIAVRPRRGDVTERVPGTRAPAIPVRPRAQPEAPFRWARGRKAGRLAAHPDALALLLMVALAMLLLARAWRAPLSSTLGAGTGDAGLFLWFLRWTPEALAGGQAPWVSDLLNVPDGVNALWNTSLILPGMLLGPVTLLLGPVLTLNLLATAGPALSGWTAYLVIRRWVAWAPAAAAGGLVFGFSPAMVGQSRGHLHMTLLVFVPVLLALLDEVLVRQRRPAHVAGSLLGLCAFAQLLTGEEVLAMAGVLGAGGVLALAAAHPRLVPPKAGYALRAFAVAGLVFALLAAWPLAVQLRGPGRVSGDVQAGSRFAADLLGTLVPTGAQALAPAPAARLAESFPGNLAERGAYLGLPVVALALATAVGCRRVGVVRLAALLAAASAVGALGPRLHVAGRATGLAMPWALAERLPLLESAVPSRFALFTALFAGILVAVGLDRARRGGGRLPAACLLALALVPLVPAGALGAIGPVQVPDFFTGPGVRRIPAGSTALVLPYARPGSSIAMAWQAEAGLRFRMPGGYFVGPAEDGSPMFGARTTVLARTLSAIDRGARFDSLDGRRRRGLVADLLHWDVRTVVVGPSRTAGPVAELMTGLLGRQPERVGGVLVWYDVEPRLLLAPPTVRVAKKP